MAKISVCYEGDEPIRLNIMFARGEVRWDKQCFYVPITEDIEHSTIEDYPDIVSVLIDKSELVRSSDNEDLIGISLSLLVHRLDEYYGSNLNLNDIEQFIIYIADIAEIMDTAIRPLYNWKEW